MLRDNSANVKAEINSRANSALTKASEMMKGAIVKNTPVDTGGLKGSIGYELNIDGHKSTARVGSTMAYAPYVEYGTGEFAENGTGRKGGWKFKDASGHWWFTHGQRPTRFMRTSFQDNEAKVKTIVEQTFGGM